jgi:MoaA/NifB/PqqE/SkfB family radical SAM enzyme
MKNTIQLEVTTRCTIGCSLCVRTQVGKELPIADCDIMANARACIGYDHVVLCGNHGDPIYHPGFHELLTTIRELNPSIGIHMHTNGSFRTQQWWQKTAQLLTPNDTVVFSIDGMPHNNHIYRVNSDWTMIENAVNTLVNSQSGAKIVWKWILFSYNQDDVEAGIELSRQLGFNRFSLVFSTRPDDSPLTHSKDTVKLVDQLSQKYKIRSGEPDTQFDDTRGWAVSPLCETRPVEPYIDAKGYYFPCCFAHHQHNERKIQQFFGDDWESLNVANNTLDQILTSSAIARLKSTWPKGEFDVCAKKCGNNATRQKKHGMLYIDFD